MIGILAWDHVKSLYKDAFHPRMNVIIHASIPMAVAIVGYTPKLPPAYEIDILPSISIITGLLFSLIVFLIQLRYQVRVGIKNTHVNEMQPSNLDYAFHTSVYLIVLGIAIVSGLLAQQAGSVIFEGCSLLRQLSNAFLFGAFAHFMMTISLVLKRLLRVYDYYGKNN